jgi:signal peptide peptidase SppA
MPPKAPSIVPADLPRSARIDEYFDTWNIDETRGGSLEQQIRSCDWTAHLREFETKHAERQAAGDSASRLGYTVQNGVAVLELEGTLMKQESSFGGTSTVAARRALSNAVRDPNVMGVLLKIDSPGGTAAGTGDLADAVADAGKTKPVWAFCEDCCCSAAYFIASQASKIYANAGATVGSIGTYMVVRDLSGAYAANGVKVHVVRAGKHKGTGTAGAEVTAEQLAELQRYVDQVNGGFVAAVARGRQMTSEQAAELADGRVHVGSAAQALKLIDGVQSWDRTLADFTKLVQQKTGGKRMDPNQGAEKATITDLRQACQGATDTFLLAQLERGATVNGALQAFVAEQRQKLEALQADVTKLTKERDDLKAQVEQLEQKKPGSKPLQENKNPPNDGAGETQLQQFERLVDDMVKAGKQRHEAVAAVCRANPELRQAWVDSTNAERKKAS